MQYKIYIKDYKSINKKIFDKLEIYLYHKKEIVELFSDEGFYCIKNNKIFKKNIIDVPVKYIFFDDKIDLIIDRSYIEENEIISHIPFKHIVMKKNVYYYSTEPNNKCLYFVIEFYHNENEELNISDFYFLANGDIDDYLIKKEINVFLSVLN